MKKIENGHIVYGQGNLLFDYSNHPMWQEELLVEILLKDRNIDINFVPIVKRDFAIDVANGDEHIAILSAFKGT